MHAAIAQLRAHLLRHLLVASIVLGMLLVPATCANATGPHSLFMTPMAQHDPSMHHGKHHTQTHDSGMAMDMPGMPADEHAMHMAMSHAAANDDLVSISAEPEVPANTPPAIKGDAPAGETGVRLTDLPSTMAMVAVSNPVTIAELDAIHFPSTPVASPRPVATLTGRAIALELPPPRFS